MSDKKKLEPIFKAAMIPQHEGLQRHYAPADPDWRPPQMHGLPRMQTQSLCGCYMHFGANFQEWIFCPEHALGPDALMLLKQIVLDLPEKRDWLDPDVETQVRKLLKLAEVLRPK